MLLEYQKKNNSSDVRSGASNENIVQNHLNIALLNVFWYLTVDIGITCITGQSSASEAVKF